MRKQLLIVGVLVLLLGGLLGGAHDSGLLAQGFTPTPAPLSFPTAEPLRTQLEPVDTPLPTFTPTEQGPPVLQLREGAGEVNLRAQADPAAEIIGTLGQGEQYVVTGQFYRWYRIRYDQSRTGEAYVFGDLVTIIGDEAEITDLTQVEQPTADPTLVGPTQTYEAILNAEGGELTLTAQRREIPAPGAEAVLPGGAAAPEQTAAVAPSGPTATFLPTFTYPPDVVAQAPTTPAPGSAAEDAATPQPAAADAETEEGLAPIVPIAVLVGLGLISLLLGLLSR